MKKVISFSLYGNKPTYQVGAIVNVIEAMRLFPEWVCRFYTTDDNAIKNQLKYLGAEVVDMREWPLGQTFWRFIAVDDPEVDVCIIRDADSIVNERELVAINQWLESGKQWHIIRDHPSHRGYPIFAGMWGHRKTENSIFNDVTMMQKITDWQQISKVKTTNHHGDQIFLKWLYETKIRNDQDYFRHGPQGEKIPPHDATRYTAHIGARTMTHGNRFKNQRAIQGFDKDFFENNNRWPWWRF